MTALNKKYTIISILLIIVGAFKIYTKGFYLETGELNWFNLFVPLGLGVVALLFMVIKILVANTTMNQR